MFHAERPRRAAPPPLILQQDSTYQIAQATPLTPSALSLHGLTKAFGTHRVLDDVSISVPVGKIFGVIGKSGAGKTTLIRIASLLEQPDRGSVDYAEMPVSGLRGTALLEARRQAGFVFQNFNLFSSRTVKGNVSFPLEAAKWHKSDIDSRVDELLDFVGLADKINRPANRLSGGERQRVAIARALANHPRILFCDEATSALDPETTRSILDLIRSLRDKFGLTVVMVTHQMEVVRRICDDVAILSGGTVVEQGSVQSVFERPRSDMAKRLVSEVPDA